jgi:outer membrane receptor protein involved in Fe transport
MYLRSAIVFRLALSECLGFFGNTSKTLRNNEKNIVHPLENKTMSRASTKFGLVAVCLFTMLILVASVFAQETTGGLQGTVKDPSGAVVPRAQVVLTGTSLAGAKSQDSDNGGQYHFANLPPGVYTVTVKAQGFSELKREGIAIEIGHLPTLDLTLAVGAAGTVVEVSGAAPVIDVTTNTNQTNLTSETLNDTPHGYSFQSVIQYAPMARNEPLAGGSAGMTGNSGGSLPGSAGNGLAVGFSVGGAADSENSYLVEGQDTENISGGASNANVPFQFIQEVQVKSSGIEAEHGGALGGVVNVVMKKGSNGFHGSFFGSYESDALDGSENATLRYDPTPAPIPSGLDDDAQTYVPKRDHFRIATPGFTVGGPIMKDRLWFFLGVAPEYNSTARTVNFAPALCTSIGGCPSQNLGVQDFTQDNQQYFTTARLDFTATQKIRLFGSWLYQYSRESGDSLPSRDPINSQAGSYLNTSIFTPVTQFSHGLGYSSPNATYNTGADITLTPRIVATTRYGYFFTNYHDFGWPTQGVNLLNEVSGLGGVANCNTAACTPSTALPAALLVPDGTTTAPFDQSYTQVNASKHYQFDQDVAVFKSGWGGTHNLKFGYQLNHLSNVINQHGNLPLAQMYPGAGNSYSASTATGGSNCALLEAEWGSCAGQYGYVTIEDFATVLKTTAGATVPATDWNHALFVQDAWTVGHGLTLNLGIRVEKENLPAPSGIGVNISSINFSWSQKVEPRLGAAWGSRDGKMKIFGSYGVTNDVMKLLLAQTSWGAQGFENCTYPIGPDGTSNGFVNSDINTTFNAINRACPTGIANVGANFIGGAPSASLTDAGSGVSLIENVNLRPEEPVAHGVNPYRQHEYVAGVDYQIAKDWAFEARYDRRRLDHVIEDASLADPNAFEIYSIVNPGQGVDKSLNGYANYLTSLKDAYGPGTAAFNPTGAFGTCTGCPANPVATRDYDGVELRLTKTQSRGWSGMFSYTWSRLWGNYTGLTTTDQNDGGTTGRNSPDTTRAFDEPFYYFADTGKSNDGALPTDRPNAFKGFVYYTLPWKGATNTTTIGLFQVAYQGSPVSSYVDLGLAADQEPIEATYIFGRGQFANVTANPSNGDVTLGTPYARRTPWYTQSDMNVLHAIKVNHNNEHQVLSFSATLTNLFNQHSVTSYFEGFDSNYFNTALFPYQGFTGAAFYQTVEEGYNPQNEINSQIAGTCVYCKVFGQPLPLIKDSEYGQPNIWQISRKIRLGVQFTF